MSNNQTAFKPEVVASTKLLEVHKTFERVLFAMGLSLDSVVSSGLPYCYVENTS